MFRVTLCVSFYNVTQYNAQWEEILCQCNHDSAAPNYSVAINYSQQLIRRYSPLLIHVYISQIDFEHT